MRARFLDSRYVPAGFEMLLLKDTEGDVGRFWDLWFNTTLANDPDKWDGEIRRVNALQTSVGELTTEQRLIRAQMAALCRVNPLFPHSVDLLCEEIGAERYQPVRLGCEGRSLLELLGHESPESADAQRTELLTRYRQGITVWSDGQPPRDAWEARVLGYLGAPEAAKQAYVERLLAACEPSESSILELKATSQALCRETQGEAVFGTSVRPWECFACEGNATAVPQCGCTYGLAIDAALLCIGALDGRAPAAELRRHVQESVLAYCLALNAWLLGAAPRPVTALTEMRYLTADVATRLAEDLPAILGARTDGKAWLVACLLKTLKSNQRWSPRTELLDEFTEATSWFDRQ